MKKTTGDALGLPNCKFDVVPQQFVTQLKCCKHALLIKGVQT